MATYSFTIGKYSIVQVKNTHLHGCASGCGRKHYQCNYKMHNVTGPAFGRIWSGMHQQHTTIYAKASILTR